MANIVHVKNISAQTDDKEVRDFFSFCGKITSLDVNNEGDTKSATVTFEKETAAKTALLLDNTQLGNSTVQVSGSSSDPSSGAPASSISDEKDDEHDIPQEDKPRSRIVAEYLAHGYVIGDHAIQKAIDLDNKHGVSSRFTLALQQFDQKYKATDRAQQLDSQYHITDRANAGWKGLQSYFEKAANTPTGQRIATFYTESNKKVQDIHNEARRLADLKRGRREDPEAKAANEKTIQQVPGSDQTTCQCGGVSGVCPCENCACAGCAKAGLKGEHTATGPADNVAAGADVQPLGEKV